jgi:tRNA(adenine34) deaminase
MFMDKKFMQRAIELAKTAAKAGEIPVGAVIVQGDRIIAEGINTRERENTALGHAEINAIAAACKVKRIGVLMTAIYMLPLSPVLCAPVQYLMQG